MNKKLVEQTFVDFTLKIQVDTDREAELIHLLQLLISVIVFFVGIGQKVSSYVYNLGTLIIDLIRAIRFTVKVFSIGLNSLAYGIGLTL